MRAFLDISGLDGEQKLIATHLDDMIRQAKAGRVETSWWLVLAAPRWLPILTPSNVDPVHVHERALRKAGISTDAAEAIRRAASRRQQEH